MEGKVFFSCLLAIYAVAIVIQASVVDFSPGSTQVLGGMVYRMRDQLFAERMKRDTNRDINLNTMIPGVPEITDYELNHGCRCTAFYNCCNETRTAGHCPEAIDIRSNLEQNHCRVSYHECCDINLLCDDDLLCISRLTLIGGEGAKPGPDQTGPPAQPDGLPHPGPPSPPAEPDVKPQPAPLPPPLPPPPVRPPLPPAGKCGVRNVDGVSVRLAGVSGEIKQTQYGEFPWMAAILRVDTVGRDVPADVYLCGGVLVSPSIVLTAAHCVADFAKEGHFFNLKVRLGEWDAVSDLEPFRQEDYMLTHVLLHPEFKPRVVLNDVAVLVLDRRVQPHQHISPICLPDQESDYQQHRVPGCIVTGWGKDSFYGQYQNILKLIEVPTVPKEECEEKMRTSRLGLAFRLHPSFICAGGEGVDACKGDGGSPLVCPSVHAGRDERNPRYVLTGLVSWGISCANVWPGVYANIPYLMPWLRGFIKEHDPDYSYSSRD